MAMFIPRQQLQNMLQAQANQVLANSTDPTARMIALNTLANTQPTRIGGLYQPMQPTQPQQIDDCSSGWDWVGELF